VSWTTTSTSSSLCPLARQLQHHIQQQQHYHSQQQRQHQLYNLLLLPPTITLPSISTNSISINTNSQYLGRNDKEIGSSLSWHPSRDLQHQRQHPVYQSQQSNINKRLNIKTPSLMEGMRMICLPPAISQRNYTSSFLFLFFYSSRISILCVGCWKILLF